MFPRLAILALMTLPVAACDSAAMSDLRRGVGLDQTAAEPEQPTGPRPPAVSPLEQPIETGAAAPRTVATAEPLTYRATSFVAGGTAPAWNVQISGNTAVYRTPDNPSGRSVAVNRLIFDRGVEYIGVVGGRPFVVNLQAAECRDSASNERFPLTARVTVTGSTQTGCATPAQPATAEAAPAPAG